MRPRDAAMTPVLAMTASSVRYEKAGLSVPL